jgi:FkbM family methyltransferase
MLNFAKRGIEQLFWKAGFELVPSYRAYKAGLRPDIVRLVNSLQLGMVIDVGANEGQFKKFMRSSVGYSGKVISFEPIPDMAAVLIDESKSDPNWRVVPEALGAEKENLELNVSTRSDFSSFLNLSEKGREIFDGAQISTTVSVKVTTLSDFLCLEKIDTEFFLKLDTQGFDLQVVLGGQSHISSQCALLLCEVSVIPIYDNQPDWREMVIKLNDMGFDLVGLYPVNRTSRMQVIEFDCLMVNKRFLAQ